MANFTYIDLVSGLKIKPAQVIHCLTVPLGSKVEKGMLIAQKKGFLGKRQQVKAPMTGILESLEEGTGRLKLVSIEIPTSKVGPVKKLPTKKTQRHGVIACEFGFGKAQGKLVFLKDDLNLEDLKEDLKDSIVAVGKLQSIGTIFKAAAVGIRGLVVETGNKDWLTELEPLISSQENHFSLLIISFADSTGTVKKWHHREAICDGQNKQLIIMENKV